MKQNLNSFFKIIFGYCTRADKILFVVIFILSCLTLFLMTRWNPAGQQAVIEINGHPYSKLNLLEPQHSFIPGKLGTMTITVRDGQIAVTESPCPQQVCVHSGAIYRSGELLVCVPNRVVIRIPGHSNNSLDMVTH